MQCGENTREEGLLENLKSLKGKQTLPCFHHLCSHVMRKTCHLPQLFLEDSCSSYSKGAFKEQENMALT